MATKQLTFDHLTSQRLRPRPANRGACAVARADQQKVIEAAATGHSPAREREIERIRGELHTYIRLLGVGSEFQASDFIERLHAIGCPPDTQIVDPRCTGGMFVRLVNLNVLRVVGHRCNKGNTHTGYASTNRPVYVIDSLPGETTP